MTRISWAVCLLLLVALSTVYEVQGTFLLRHYLRKFPRRSRGFRPFACKGMLKFVNLLEFKSPGKPEYKSLFGNLRSYVNALGSGSNVDLQGKAQGVQSALSALGGSGGPSVDTSKVMDVLTTMGKTLGSDTSSSSTEMTTGQRKELLTSLVKWAQTIGQFVASAASKSGSSFDIKSLGIDGIDSNVATGGGSTTTNTQTGASTTGNFMGTGAGTGTVPVPGMGGATTGNFMDTTGAGTVPGIGMAGGPTTSIPGIGMAGGPASSTEGGSSFGRSFSGKTGSTNYAGSVNYQSGQKSSQQTATGNTGSPGSF